jgi:RNA polymerase sigma-70 factor (ECF subfamily)
MERSSDEELSDEELLGAVAGGDEAAFRALAARVVPSSLRLARSLLRGTAEADAEDIVQEAMLRVWVNAPRWRPERPFRAWLYRILVNLIANRRRRARAVPLAEIDEPLDPGQGALADIEARETDRLVAQAIAALPERQRDAVVLTYQEGLSNAEVAEILETTVAGVEALLVRARRSIRARLGAHFDAPGAK